ncbi:MAG: EamA family transporter [Thermoanaerobacteraceae bacterium]|nr:EamA family transporter [Thermoanaerobacteraceae bacterium]
MERGRRGAGEFWGLFLVTIAAASLGMEGIAAKFAFAGGASSLAVLALRFPLAALIFWASLAWFGGRWKIGLGTLGRLAALAVGGHGMTVVLLFYAFQHIPASLAILLFYIYPVLVTLLAAVFLREPLTRAKMEALVLASAGLVITLGLPAGRLHMGGAVAACLAAVANSIFMVGQTELLRRVETRVFNAYLTLVLAVLFLPVALLSNQFRVPLNAEVVGAVLVLALVCTVVASETLCRGLVYIGASRAAIILTLEPVVTAVLGYLLLNERLYPSQLLGGALILAGVARQQVAEYKAQGMKSRREGAGEAGGQGRPDGIFGEKRLPK